MQIKRGAIFLSDAHENANKTAFLNFLESINSKILSFDNPPQIFLLGDMFDFLTDTDYVKKFYSKQISLINEISKHCEIYYFEGNHDFNLSEIFPNVKIFPNSIQPVKFEAFSNQTVQIAHGDIFLPPLTQKILLSLRNKKFLKIMNKIDKILNFKISKMILNSQKDKILYKKAENFKNFIEPKIDKYETKFIIEGHYHQDEILNFGDKKYVNLNSFSVCEKIYIADVDESGNLTLISRKSEFF